MDADELARLIEFAPEHSCCIDISAVDGAPGYIRTTTMHRNNRVAIEFDVWGNEDGGLYFWFTYSDFEHAIDSISAYLGRELPNWIADPEYPDRDAGAGLETSHHAFKSILTNGTLDLPEFSQMEVSPNYWLEFLHPKYLASTPGNAG